MSFKHRVKLLLSFIVVRIKGGPLKGKRWIWSSGGKFIRGTQEPYKTEALLKSYKPGSVFFDIGAHFGYYSAIAAMLNGDNGMVYAFEPRPMNARFFRKHMRINGFKNVTLFECATGRSDEEVGFNTRTGSATGHVDKSGSLKVKQVSVSGMVKDGRLPPPDFIKIDVEGGEIEVLSDLRQLIAEKRPRMVIATHNDECHDFVTGLLQELDYNFEVLNPNRTDGDTEIIALPDGSLRSPA